MKMVNEIWWKSTIFFADIDDTELIWSVLNALKKLEVYFVLKFLIFFICLLKYLDNILFSYKLLHIKMWFLIFFW